MRWWVVVAILVAALAVGLLLGRPRTPAPPPAVGAERSAEDGAAPTDIPPPIRGSITVTTTETADCSGPADAAARANAASVDGLAWSPFGRPETGWRIYATLIGAEIGTRCPPESAAFATRLAEWQRRHALSPDGLMSGAVFDRLKTAWHARRPLVLSIRARGCPAPPAPDRLETARISEGYRGKSVQARPAVLAAYRRMVADARRDDPAIAADPQMLTIFSAYRDPASDALRCLREANCDGVRRARSCSPHRTGLALDLTVGAAPGFTVDSTADPNRLAQSRTPAYRWLVANAGRYGFVNYPFEPWHWEWTGEAP